MDAYPPTSEGVAIQQSFLQPLQVFLLFPHAKGFEDDVEDVVGVGGAGDEVEGAEGVVKVQEEHFVRRFPLGGLAGLRQAGEGVLNELLVAQVGNEFAFRPDVTRRGRERKYLFLEFRNSLAGQRRGTDDLGRSCSRVYTTSRRIFCGGIEGCGAAQAGR